MDDSEDSLTERIFTEAVLQSKSFMCLRSRANETWRMNVKGKYQLFQETEEECHSMSFSNESEKQITATEVKLNQVIEKKGNNKEKTAANNNEWSLCDHDNLPSWLQDNEYLVNSHRPQLSSFYECFISIFRFHTETLNIWTHLLACTFFFILGAFFLMKPSIGEEKWVFTPFFLGTTVCFAFSFCFHTMYCHSPQMQNMFSRLDYCGISLLIMAASIPWIYYGFYCSFWLKILYLSLEISLGSSAIVVSLTKRFNKRDCRIWRAIVFTSFALCGVIPASHLIYIVGWERFMRFASTLIVTSSLYIIGVIFYALRIPERFMPGAFDIWFHSHQIFHVLVAVATYIKYEGLTSAINSKIHECNCI